MQNFNLVFFDTDSITFCKPDGAEFSLEEQDVLQTALNSLFPQRIRWEKNFYVPKVVVLKTKNYVVFDPNNSNPKKKLTLKGSGIKASTKEPALKEFIRDIIDSMLFDRGDYREIYLRYAQEILGIRDMSRWVTRRTISDKVLSNTRTNESKIRDAIQGTDYVEGDRVYLYFRSDGTLNLLEKFSEDYCRKTLLRKLHATAQLFGEVLDVRELFPNLSLKRSAKYVEELLCRSTVA